MKRINLADKFSVLNPNIFKNMVHRGYAGYIPYRSSADRSLHVNLFPIVSIWRVREISTVNIRKRSEFE